MRARSGIGSTKEARPGARVVGALAVLLWWAPGTTEAQEAAGLGLSQQNTRGLGLSSGERAERRREERGRAWSVDWERPTQPQDAVYGYWPTFRRAYWLGGAPWWAAPGTVRTKAYPPPVAVEPRLGLQWTYPYAWQMGIQIPHDTDPLYTYSLGGFRGIVGSPQYPAWLYEQEGIGGEDEWIIEDESGDLREALTRMRAADYRGAGLLLAEGYRDSDDVRYPILLVEALAALGKYRHADLLLRKTLAMPGAIDALPADPASHFPSKEAFRTVAAGAGGGTDLLDVYLRIFLDPESALDDLARTAESDSPVAELAGALYRRYLARAFAGEPAAAGGIEKVPDVEPADPAPRADEDGGS